MKIAIGNDHAAVEMKQEIRTYLEEKGYEVINLEQIPMKAAIIRNMVKQSDVQLQKERQTVES